MFEDAKQLSVYRLTPDSKITFIYLGRGDFNFHSVLAPNPGTSRLFEFYIDDEGYCYVINPLSKSDRMVCPVLITDEEDNNHLREIFFKYHVRRNKDRIIVHDFFRMQADGVKF